LSNRRRLRACAVIPLFSLTVTATAAAAGGPSSGGLAPPARPDVSEATCATGETWACARGERLIVRGDDLRDVREVLFLGRSGRHDDRVARLLAASPHRVVVTVPAGARTGRLMLRARAGLRATSPRSVRVQTPRAAPQATAAAGPGSTIVAGARTAATFAYRVATGSAARIEAVRVDDGQVVRTWAASPSADGTGEVRWDGMLDGGPASPGQYVLRLAGGSDQASAPFSVVDAVFPIDGKHDLGPSTASNFGGGRGHQGQDMFAACGTPLVAARAGRVQFAATQSRAGNYVVLQSPDGQSYAYMHMRDRALVSKGEVVYAGQPVGYVGETGRASGCHLHFELWTAPGWYEGGKAVDPVPDLRRWIAFG